MTSRPASSGRFGRFGGQYVPETLMPALAELEVAAAEAWKDPAFTSELNRLLKTYVGRATPLYEAERLTAHYRRADGGRGGIRGAVCKVRRELCGKLWDGRVF